MARPGTGGRGSGGGSFSGSRSGGSSSGGRSSGGSRPAGGSSYSGGSSSSGRSSSSDRSSSGGGSFFGNSSSSPKKYTTSSSSSGSSSNSRSSGGSTFGSSGVSNNGNQGYHDYNGGMGPGYGGFGGGYGYHGHHHWRPSLFRRLFYRRGYGDYYYQNVSYVKSGLGCGCLVFFIIPFVAAMVVAIVLAVTGYRVDSSGDPETVPYDSSASHDTTGNTGINGTGTEHTYQTVRTPLSPDKVAETGYYQDDLGWIETPETLLAGLKEFYSLTGVQPYLRLAAPVSNTNSNAECDAFANRLYDELFTDEGHFLLVYVENTDPDEIGYLAYVCGSDAVSVMDDPAVDILYQYADRYWFDESLSTEEVFANVFRDTALDIMSQTVVSGGWTNSGRGFRFIDDNGEELRNIWAEIDEILYYFNPDGNMVTGWFQYNDEWFYANESGAIVTGWLDDGGTWYYLGEDGKMLRDTTTPDGYYLDSDGVWTP